MKNLFPVASLLYLFTQSNVLAIDFKFITDNEFIVSQEETVNNELWLAAPSISFDGLARDDLFLLAGIDSSLDNKTSRVDQVGNIKISGYCANDLWAIANKITITGKINEHTRILAKDIEVAGTFGKSIIAISSTINCSSNATFNGNALIIGNYVVVNGMFNKNLKILSRQVTLGGIFLGDIEITAEDITVLPSAVFKGRILYDSPSEIVLSENQRAQMPQPPARIVSQHQKDKKSHSTADSQFWQLLMFLGSLPCAWFLVRFFPQISQHSVSALHNSFWKSLLVAFIILAIMPVVMIVGTISIIGIPFVVLLSILLAVMAYAGKFIVAGAAVKIFAHHNKSLRNLTFIIILFLLYQLAVLPKIGIIFSILFFLIGVGTITIAIATQRTNDSSISQT